MEKIKALKNPAYKSIKIRGKIIDSYSIKLINYKYFNFN